MFFLAHSSQVFLLPRPPLFFYRLTPNHLHSSYLVCSILWSLFKYFAAVHVGSVRQTATIVSMSSDHLRTGDKAIVRFRFIKNPEYLRCDMRMVFREGRTKAVGTVSKLFPYVCVVAQNVRQPRAAKKTLESSHQQRPQNEPQKPSKRNRRSRNYYRAQEAEVKEKEPSVEA